MNRFTALPLVLLPACVTAPFHGQSVDEVDEIRFSGIAENAGDAVVILALDRRRDTWVGVGKAFADVPVSYGGDTLHAWTTEVDLEQAGVQWECFFDEDCDDPEDSAEFMITVGDQALLPMTEADAACVVAAVDTGSRWISAGKSCLDLDRTTLTLWYQEDSFGANANAKGEAAGAASAGGASSTILGSDAGLQLFRRAD